MEVYLTCLLGITICRHGYWRRMRWAGEWQWHGKQGVTRQAASAGNLNASGLLERAGLDVLNSSRVNSLRLRLIGIAVQYLGCFCEQGDTE